MPLSYFWRALLKQVIKYRPIITLLLKGNSFLKQNLAPLFTNILKTALKGSVARRTVGLMRVKTFGCGLPCEWQQQMTQIISLLQQAMRNKLTKCDAHKSLTWKWISRRLQTLPFQLPTCYGGMSATEPHFITHRGRVSTKRFRKWCQDSPLVQSGDRDQIHTQCGVEPEHGAT